MGKPFFIYYSVFLVVIQRLTPKVEMTQEEKTLFMILLNRSNQLNKNNVENSSRHIHVPALLMIEALRQQEKEKE
ncbi:MAG TPA: hypothetical protein ENK79_02490 [Campylobacterales bacterium]|nr:hypothetical protein [Campylobacterales bacterium]